MLVRNRLFAFSMLAIGGPLVSGGAVSATAITARLGDGTVDASRLRPYANAFVVTFTFPDGTRMSPGLWTDQLQVREIDGRRLFVRTQGRTYSDGRIRMSVNAFDPVSFAPVSNFLVNDQGVRERWTFDAHHAEGHIIPPGTGAQETVRSVDLAAPAYDFNCCMLSLVPAAVRWTAGESLTLPAVPQEAGDSDSVTYQVVTRERVRAGYLGMVDAWEVQYGSPETGFVRFWISDAPPYLVRMTLTGMPSMRNAAGVHYDQSFEMIGEVPNPHRPRSR